MNIFIKGRGEGKTTELIKMSNITGYPIVVLSYSSRKFILEIAKKLGLNIPEPIIYERGVTRFNNCHVLIDELDYFLRQALGCQVESASLDRENVSIYENKKNINTTNEYRDKIRSCKNTLLDKYQEAVGKNDFSGASTVLQHIEYLNKELSKD